MNYHNITKCDMLNGEGLRVVLWVAHCPHNCVGCHNPQTHTAESGILFDVSAREELYHEMKKDYTAGITFSGGDPLSPLNREQVLELAKEFKQTFPDKTIWLYTGYLWGQIADLPGLEAVDVLVDGPFVLSQKDNTLPYRGSDNQRIIDVKASLSTQDVVLYQLR